MSAIQPSSRVLRELLRPKRLWKRIRRQRRIRGLAIHRPCRVVIGASGKGLSEGWIHTEIEDVNLLCTDSWQRFFANASIDALLAEHVWEHLTLAEGLTAAQTCYRFLRPGGYLRVAVPDGLHPDPQYIDWVRPQGNGPGCDDHQVLYTYESFGRLFEQAGFRVSLLEYFDPQGEFHFNDWHVDDGLIRRSRRFDERNRDGELCYSSVILDAWRE